MPAFWQLIWDQGVHVLTLLSAIDAQECRMFWPAQSGQHMFFDAGYQKMKVTLLDELESGMWRAYRISLEVSGSVWL